MIIPLTAVNISTIQNEKDVILKAFRAALAVVQQIPEGPPKVAAFKRLLCGSIKRSKVVGVDSVPTLEKLIRSLGEITMCVEQPESKNTVMRFQVPSQYRAFSPLTRLKDLAEELERREQANLRSARLNGGKTHRKPYDNGVYVCPMRVQSSIVWNIKFHAPEIYPLKADIITFILDPSRDNLVEWYAGEDISLWPPTADIGSQWVHLGVDLVAENIKKTRNHEDKS